MKVKNRNIVNYLVICLSHILLIACSIKRPYPLTPFPIMPTDEQYKGTNTPYLTNTPVLATPVESGQRITVTPIALDVELITSYTSFPSGQYLVYYDSRNDFLHLLPMNEKNSDIEIINQWGNLTTDGKRFAYIENLQMSILNLTNARVEHIPLSLKCYFLPSWSPAGDNLAIECENNIYIYSMSGQSFSRVTEWSQKSVDAYSSPVWSPDGSQIAYSYRQLSSLKITFEDGVYTTQVDCLNEPSTCEEKTQGPYIPYSYNILISWSPDSRYLTIADETKSIRIVDLQNNEVRHILKSPEYIDGIAWSPDGNWIAYSSNGKIFIISPEDKEPILLVKDAGEVMSWVVIPFQLGDFLEITETGSNLNLHEDPSLASDVLMQLQSGDIVTILDGPVKADGYTWWYMQVKANGTEGWAEENHDWYSPVNQ